MRVLEQHIDAASLVNTVNTGLIPCALAHADNAGHNPAGNPGRDQNSAATVKNPHAVSVAKAAAGGFSGVDPHGVRLKLAQHDGIISKAAEDSGIPRQHFSLLMKRFMGSEGIENS